MPFEQHVNDSYYKFYELFDTTSDPWEITNIYDSAPAALKAALHDLAVRNFECSGSTCFPAPHIKQIKTDDLATGFKGAERSMKTGDDSRPIKLAVPFWDER